MHIDGDLGPATSLMLLGGALTLVLLFTGAVVATHPRYGRRPRSRSPRRSPAPGCGPSCTAGSTRPGRAD